MANEQRFYRNVSSIEEAHIAIKELTDHTYDLRHQMNEMKDLHAKALDGVHKQMASLSTGIFSQICGINVKAVTDPKSLQNGYTVRYNAATGQFEFGV